MNAITSQASLTVQEVVAGLLPAIAESVKAAEFNAGNKLENALKGVEAVYTQTSISSEITFQTVKESVMKCVELLVSHYHTIGAFNHAPQLKLA